MNWAWHIKHELDSIGFSDIWTIQLLIDILFKQIKLRITDSYKYSWFSKIVNSSRLSTHTYLKYDFGFENYLNELLIPKFRTTLTRFRISAHSLTIETGSHQNIEKKNERKCIFFNMNAIESEYHFKLVCPNYSDLRQKYLPRYYCRWPTINKFTAVMSKQSKYHIEYLSRCLYFAFQNFLV